MNCFSPLVFFMLMHTIPIIYALLLGYWVLKIRESDINYIVTPNLFVCGAIMCVNAFITTPLGITAVEVTDNGLVPIDPFATESGYTIMMFLLIISFIIIYLIYFCKMFRLKKIKKIIFNKAIKIHFVLFPLILSFYIYALVFKPYY